MVSGPLPLDENVCQAIVRFLDGVVASSTIDRRGIWLIDTRFRYAGKAKPWCLSVKDVVARSIKQIQEMDETPERWLREAREHLREAIALLDEVL